MVKVQIIGVPVACKEGLKDTWREVAAFTKGQLEFHFKDEVKVEYFDLFDKECPLFPRDAQIPIVLVDGKIFSSGGKIAIPKLRTYLESKITK